MRSAKSSLLMSGSASDAPLRSRIVAMLVSPSNPLPASATLLATIMSRFFSRSFLAALAVSSSVSAAKPINTLPSLF